MKKAKEITGEKFGKLKVLKRAGSSKNGLAMWECLCECGKIKNIVGTSLRNGNTTSCGCKKFDNFKNRGGVVLNEKRRKEIVRLHIENKVKQTVLAEVFGVTQGACFFIG